MRTVRALGVLAVWGSILCGSLPASAAPTPSPEEIAAKSDWVVAAIQGRNAAGSAAIVAEALQTAFASDWPDAKRRGRCIAIVTYAVAAKGQEAAPMMRIVAARIPPAWLPVVAATAIVAAGNNSPAVAAAMLEAVAGDAALAAACRAACADPSTILPLADMALVRGITLPAAVTPPLVVDSAVRVVGSSGAAAPAGGSPAAPAAGAGVASAGAAGEAAPNSLNDAASARRPSDPPASSPPVITPDSPLPDSPPPVTPPPEPPPPEIVPPPVPEPPRVVIYLGPRKYTGQ